MWSHYADEHRGGVVEFTFDLENQSHARTLVQRGFFKNLLTITINMVWSDTEKIEV